MTISLTITAGTVLKRLWERAKIYHQSGECKKAVAALIINIINIYCVNGYSMKKIRSSLTSLLCYQPKLNPKSQFTNGEGGTVVADAFVKQFGSLFE